MMINEAKKIVEDWTKKNVESIYLLPPSASPRRYYRAIFKDNSVIITYGSNIEENNTFIAFSKNFRKKDLKVPEIFFVSDDNRFYIQSDLGDDRLYDYILRKGWNSETKSFYKKTLDELLRFQTLALSGLDLSVAYPRDEFDRQSIMWDLNYFKYYFLKLAEIDFHEQRLEDDFNSFTELLLTAERKFFLYRDFQTRNVMVYDETPYFIDYQGGRKGALHYDVASLLYDAKADMPDEIKIEMLEYYIDALSRINRKEADKFLDLFYYFVLVRMLQAMGAFGFRGVIQRKPHFVESIPYAIRNVKKIVNEKINGAQFPELTASINKLSEKQFEELI